MKNFADLLQATNQRLRQANIRLTIEQNGNRLCLRGTFPPKPNGHIQKTHQQRLSLHVAATPQGLKFAEAKAKEVSAQLDFKVFNWADFLSVNDQLPTIGELIQQFKKDYFVKRKETPQSLLTWQEDYQKPFNRLPNNSIISVEILTKIITQIEPDTRQRKRFTLAYAKLADFAGLEHQLRSLGGCYSSKRVTPRSVPSDLLIAQTYDIIPTNWRWAYGILATYGLRNHELFFIDLEDYPVIFVNRGKTGERYVWPIYPEWGTMWNLDKFSLPQCSGKTHGDLGHRVSQAFRRSGCPFSPYNLRHAWAIRSLEFGLNISLAAAQMGHSLTVHSQTYHHWISRATHERAMKLLLERSDRPKPPNLTEQSDDLLD